MSVPLQISPGPARTSTVVQQTKNPKLNTKLQVNPRKPGLQQQLLYLHCIFCIFKIFFGTRLTVTKVMFGMYKSGPNTVQRENLNNYILAEYKLSTWHI